MCYRPFMSKVQIWGYRCERCGHEWVPREKDHEPKVCPACKSAYWDRPRQQRPKQNDKKVESQ